MFTPMRPKFIEQYFSVLRMALASGWNAIRNALNTASSAVVESAIMAQPLNR